MEAVAQENGKVLAFMPLFASLIRCHSVCLSVRGTVRHTSAPIMHQGSNGPCLKLAQVCNEYYLRKPSITKENQRHLIRPEKTRFVVLLLTYCGSDLKGLFHLTMELNAQFQCTYRSGIYGFGAIFVAVVVACV